MVGDDGDRLSDLVLRIVEMGRECEWVEIKHNNADPQQIGEYISALSNAAALAGESRGYMLWGLEDQTLDVVGTSFNPDKKAKGNEDLRPWLARLLEPGIDFHFSRFEFEGKSLVLLEVPPATSRPVRFSGTAFIRIGPHKKPLSRSQEHERRLWQVLSTASYETVAAAVSVSSANVLKLLDFESYFSLTRRPLPASETETLEALETEGFIQHVGLETGWSITNLGALSFARSLSSFANLERRAPRVIVYSGNSRASAAKEQVGVRGYASAFAGMIHFINESLPTNEVLGEALRVNEPLFPQIAVRELVANALIHQDLAIAGSSPIVEIFPSRMEISNPGLPVVSTDRFIDSPPRSRNEKLAGLMRKLGICEERGSGWDKVAESVEVNQLPSPLIEASESYTKVTLFGPKKLAIMDRDERVRAIYQHACLRHVMGESTTNASVRKRFGLPDTAKTKASRMITEAVDAGVIVAFDPSVGAKARRYLPVWAGPGR